MARFNYDDIVRAENSIDPVFRNTPQFECDTLSKQLGCRVFLKVETLNPIRSFKGRGADLLCAVAKDNHIMCASAGNFGQAMAWACAKQNKQLTVYASVHANPFKVSRMKELGASVILEGDDFDGAKLIAKKAAREKNIRFVEDSLDVETVVGAGTIGMELFRQFAPDMIVIPVGNGALINGIAAVSRYHSPNTKIVGVQSDKAPAMVESWQSEKIVVHDKADTIADGIAVRVPVAEAVYEMRELVHRALLTDEETIVKAMQLIRLHAGILVEPSGAVGLAALLQNRELFAGQRVALILTGSNLTDQQIRQWF